MDQDKFRDLLEAQMSFPGSYTFKFVIPNQEEALLQLKGLLPGAEIGLRESKTGKYLSVTAKKIMTDADEVVAVYHSAKLIEGVIAL